MDINNSGNVLVNEICDLSGQNCKIISALLTGFSETDPVFMGASGDYLLLANSGTYYNDNPTGYIT